MSRESQAVQFGAGKIGRGFLGQILFEGGYQTTFVDDNTNLVDALNLRGEYPLRLVSEGRSETLRIGNLRGLDAGRDKAQVTQAIVQADLIGIAVGAHILTHITPALAAGLNARASAGCGPIDILLCENQWHAASLVRELLSPHITHLAKDYFDTQVGLVETVIGRMVPGATDAQRQKDALLVVAEPYKELPIAKKMLRNGVPYLPGLIAADDFEAYEARKLYVHNMSHAALAYCGFLRGHEFLWQCASDAQAVGICREALLEIVPALVAEYHFEAALLTIFAEDLLSRFANRTLGDTVARVAADPLRKLRLEDRLIGAALLCLRQGIQPVALAKVIASALRYDAPKDPKAQELQRLRRELGDARVLEQVCGIEEGGELSRMILNASASYNRSSQ